MAGPRWTADIGPVERPDPPPDAAPLAGQSSVGSLAAEGSRVRLQDGLSSAGSSPESKQMLLRSMTTVNAVRVWGGLGAGGGKRGEGTRSPVLVVHTLLSVLAVRAAMSGLQRGFRNTPLLPLTVRRCHALAA